MKKLSLIPLVLVSTIGALWAATIIFPNTSEFQRSPGGIHTLSGVLSLFGLDGSAPDTAQLAGISASGYLQSRDCSSEPINRVWVGIDADGRAICGSKTVQLADIGTITERGGTLTIWRDGSPIASPVGTIVREGDTIITDASSTGTIRFAADESILRLDTSTTVELSIGQLSGQSVAQAILTDGRLWGRILSSTGVNLGGGGLVAGVRGTSVDIAKSGTAVSLYIVDSQNAIAATIQNSDNSLHTGNTVSSGVLLTYTSGSANTPVAMPSPIYRTKSELLTSVTDATWIRSNTLADIDHLVVLSGSLADGEVRNRVEREIAATIPPLTDTTALDGMCPDTNPSSTTLGANGTADTASRKVYWQSLIGNPDPCKLSSLYAYADYTVSDLLLRQGDVLHATLGNDARVEEGKGIKIDGSKYIEYSANTNIGNKLITMTVDNVLIENNKTIAEFTYGRIKKITGGYQCTWLTPGNQNCVTVNGNALIFTMPANATSFVLGNNAKTTIGSILLNAAIGVTIQNIKITNIN